MPKKVERIGYGYSYLDIAKELGILNKTNDNPNKHLIKHIIENYIKNKQVTGEITITEDVYSNGKIHGYRYKIPLYSRDIIEQVRFYIYKRAIIVNKDMYNIDGIDFKVGGNNERFIKVINE